MKHNRPVLLLPPVWLAAAMLFGCGYLWSSTTGWLLVQGFGVPSSSYSSAARRLSLTKSKHPLPLRRRRSTISSSSRHKMSPSDDATLSNADNESAADAEDPVQRLRREAARIRLEAEYMDLELTLRKMSQLQDKMHVWHEKLTENPVSSSGSSSNAGAASVADLPNELDKVKQQLEQMRRKLIVDVDENGSSSSSSSSNKSSKSSSKSDNSNSKNNNNSGSNSKTTKKQQLPPSVASLYPPTTSRNTNNNDNKNNDNNKNKFQLTSLAPTSSSVTSSQPQPPAPSSSSPPQPRFPRFPWWNPQSSSSQQQPQSDLFHTTKTVVHKNHKDHATTTARLETTTTTTAVMERAQLAEQQQQQLKSEKFAAAAATTTILTTQPPPVVEYWTADDILAQCPLAGFDDDDLAVYVPVCLELEETLPANATLYDHMKAFRAAPALQAHFQAKIQALLVQPLQNLQRLEQLREDYLQSTSRVEKDALKREMEQLQQKQSETAATQPSSFYSSSSSRPAKLNPSTRGRGTSTSVTTAGAGVAYSDSVYLAQLPPLTDEQLAQRLQAVTALPRTLQAIYKARNQLDPVNGNLTLAIYLDYYDQPLQLLEQVPYVTASLLPSSSSSSSYSTSTSSATALANIRQEVYWAVQALPEAVRQYVGETLGMTVDPSWSNNETSISLVALVDTICAQKPVDADNDDDDDEDEELILGRNGVPWSQFHVGGITVSLDGPEYDDIDFVDRSRYVQELYPALARMEPIHPSAATVEQFMTHILDRRTFAATSKPERVLGGYYIRGRNVISNDENGIALCQRIQERLAKTDLGEQLQVFYITDPTPLTDESLELGDGNEPLLFVTSPDRQRFYPAASPLAKFLVTALGISSVWIFALSCCEIQPVLRERIDATLAQGAAAELTWLTNLLSETVLSTLAIYLSHELGHQLIAWRDKFQIGLASPIPSLQIGLQGSITPLKSPPPTLNSLFDFAMAGPTLGLLASLSFLLTGLSLTTAAVDVTAGAAQSLPGLPVYMLQASALGGALVELFLGRGVLAQGITPQAVLPLHPMAIAGFAGLMANAMALLPLGHTDGGRIALAMFGRRGTYVVKSFTALIICIAGFFGFDNAHILLPYLIFVLLWQREMETPVRNEVQELDILRGGIGIVMALIVALILLPVPYAS